MCVRVSRYEFPTFSLSPPSLFFCRKALVKILKKGPYETITIATDRVKMRDAPEIVKGKRLQSCIM